MGLYRVVFMIELELSLSLMAIQRTTEIACEPSTMLEPRSSSDKFSTGSGFSLATLRCPERHRNGMETIADVPAWNLVWCQVIEYARFDDCDAV